MGTGGAIPSRRTPELKLGKTPVPVFFAKFAKFAKFAAA